MINEVRTQTTLSDFKRLSKGTKMVEVFKGRKERGGMKHRDGEEKRDAVAVR